MKPADDDKLYVSVATKAMTHKLTLPVNYAF